MQNSMMVFTFSVFDQKYHFWANLIQKIKILRLSWSLLPRVIIVIRRSQWRCSLFLFSTRNTLYGQIWSKRMKLFFLGWNLVCRLIHLFTFSVFDQKPPFWINFFQNIKMISLSWSLVPKLTHSCPLFHIWVTKKIHILRVCKR